MGGSDTTQSTQSQQVTQLPPWINQAAQQNYAQAQNVANQPLQQYQGQMVADVSPQMQQAWNLAASGGNAGADQYNASQAAYMGVLGQQPLSVNPYAVSGSNVTPYSVTGSNVTAGQLANTNLSPYMNPYTQDVINATLPLMQQQLGIAQIGNQSQAAGAGAYGGSRQGIQQGVTQAQGAMDMGEMAAALNQANFSQAQQGAVGDINRTMQAGLANQQNALAAQGMNQQNWLQTGTANQANALQAAMANQQNSFQSQYANQQAQQNQAGLDLNAAGGLANLGQAAQQSQLQNFGELMAAGGSEQAQQQNVINAQMAKFAQAQGYPAQGLGVLESALGMTPYGTSTTGNQITQTQTSGNPLGMAQSALGMLGDIAPIFMGSDRKLKTDISRVGRHHTGVPMYAYRYKGDPKSYPKVVGPMAEDVQKIAPHAVRTIPGSGGKRAINMGALGALAPPPAVVTSKGFSTPRLGAMGVPTMTGRPGTNFAALRTGAQGALAPAMSQRARAAQPRGALAFG